ncbi:MAG TPA: LuxR C-terminal-related transcriptional regulator [Candidatus Dormibacteraeota bacterium]|nr:LuxR C-terminal-related transcriptional regulator [Candidatus Dormibacteraeota bacterium]
MTAPVRPASRWVLRPRLTALLDAKPWARLALVSAPAGFGKSTAVAAWAASPGICPATVVLERADSDVARFLRVVARALGASEYGVESGPGVDRDAPTAALAIVGWLQRATQAQPEGRIALVLDDFHLVEEPGIHRIVAEVVDRAPARSLVVIVTRADPALPLARLRARDELIEVRAEDLRFSPTEAAELLRGSGIELSDDDLARLTSRTEGWAAVLRLAAIALRGRADAADAVRRFGASHRFVLDYVLEEVLGGLPVETVDFLLRTSILERLCGDLCDALTDRGDGQAILEQLERDNLLLQPLDDERRWFRYHALFAEILRGRLRAEMPDGVATLEDRASRWFEAEGLPDESIAHAFASGDAERAARLVADASLPRLNAGELATVGRWLNALGPDMVRSDAQLSLSSAWCLSLAGRLDDADRRVADAEAAHAVGRDGGAFSAPMIDAELSLIRAYIAGVRGDSATAIAAASAALELIPTGLPPRVDATLRGDATVFLARAMLAAGAGRGVETYLAALPDLRAGANVLAIGRAMSDLVDAAVGDGDVAGALRLCEEEIERTPALRRNAAYWAAVAKAREALAEGQEALEAAEQALELALRAGDTRIAGWARAAVSRLQSPAPGGGKATGRQASGLVEQLTERELEVLRLVAEGRSNRAIAEELFVTVGTVKSHVHAITGKLGAANRVEAVAIARRHRLVD